MASKNSRGMRIGEKLRKTIINFKEKNKLKNYVEAGDKIADLLTDFHVRKKKVIENIRREIEF